MTFTWAVERSSLFPMHLAMRLPKKNCYVGYYKNIVLSSKLQKSELQYVLLSFKDPIWSLIEIVIRTISLKVVFQAATMRKILHHVVT